MGGDVTVYTLLSTCPVVSRYILTVYHLFPCYHLFLVGVNYFKRDPVYFLFLVLSTHPYYVYVCSLVQSEPQKPSDVFLCTRAFSFCGFKQDYTRILIFSMPGHNHSIVPKLKPGNLGTQDAFFLWNCPIQDEGLSIRQHIIE